MSISQPAKHAKCDSWMSNNQFSLRTIIKQRRQAHYMYLQMDPLDNPLSTRPIQRGREFSKELYPNGRFGCIDNPDCQFGAGSVPTRTRTRTDGPGPLLTLQAGSSGMLTLTSVTIWLRWKQAGSGGIFTFTSLTIRLRWEQAGSGAMLTLSSLTIRLCWEQAGSGGSGLAGRGETSFTGSSGSGLAGSKLVAVDLAWLVGVKVASLGESW